MQQAFAITGNTVLVVATSSTATPTLVSNGNGYCARVVNGSTIDTYLAFGNSSTVAATLASTSGGLGVYLPGANNHFEDFFAIPPVCYLSAVTSAGSANLYVTPGNKI